MTIQISKDEHVNGMAGGFLECLEELQQDSWVTNPERLVVALLNPFVVFQAGWQEIWENSAKFVAQVSAHPFFVHRRIAGEDIVGEKEPVGELHFVLVQTLGKTERLTAFWPEDQPEQAVLSYEQYMMRWRRTQFIEEDGLVFELLEYGNPLVGSLHSREVLGLPDALDELWRPFQQYLFDMLGPDIGYWSTMRVK